MDVCVVIQQSETDTVIWISMYLKKNPNHLWYLAVSSLIWDLHPKKKVTISKQCLTYFADIWGQGIHKICEH